MNYINEKLILAYGLTQEEEGKLNSVLLKQNILPCKVIQKNMGNATIEEILLSSEIKESKIELPLEKLLLFNNYKDTELYDLIDNIRETKSASTILAAVTPTSMKWTVGYLLEHLIEERDAYKIKK
ncbi:DUF3783 domain-containing protein [Clostridium sp.]|uniref:DUF3783 domain-containing protein n=1 Tax=Clostridium sp. TaxID=1506 RepID=UPI001A3F2953|nr:DUF3783 domain-containing protein [Clostridium sp.]MBK5239699.1 DUF3783 domain-containing protein [Clostridium sp.]